MEKESGPAAAFAPMRPRPPVSAAKNLWKSMAPGSVNQVRELFPAGSPRPLPESQSHFKNPPDTPGAALPIRSPALSRPAVRLAGGRSSHPPSRLAEAARYIAIFRLEGRVPPGRAAPGHVCSAPPVRAGTAPSRLRVPPSASPARVLRPRRRAVPKPHSPGAPPAAPSSPRGCGTAAQRAR